MTIRIYTLAAGIAAAALLNGPFASAEVKGLTGPSFELSVSDTYISTADGSTVLMWGCAPGAEGMVQYPCPTLIVNQGDTVTIKLNYDFPTGRGPESITPTGGTNGVGLLFPGQSRVTAGGGQDGVLAHEAIRDHPVTYSFVAEEPGTYAYQGSTDFEVEMGVVGAIVVRPTGFDAQHPRAYAHPDSAYDYEYLFLETDIDSDIHDKVDLGYDVDMSKRFASYYMLNGRTGLDTLLEADLPWMPSQPYNALARTSPNKKVLMRIVDLGLDMHPFHHHGNHAPQIAEDGRLHSSTPDAADPAPDISPVDFTVQTTPGKTYDAIWMWTGEGLGWDVYNHAAGSACDQASEICPGVDATTGHMCDPNQKICYEVGCDPLTQKCRISYHGKHFPVQMPNILQYTAGAYWSGSQFLGTIGNQPPGEGGYNLHGGMYYMWHSHNEKELTNYNIYPGGMMTMMIVEPSSVTDIK